MGVSGCRVSQGSWVQLQTLPMSLGRDRQSRLWDETAARSRGCFREVVMEGLSEEVTFLLRPEW